MEIIRIMMDGKSVCATWGDFENLQESPAGFGDSVKSAVLDLFLDDPLRANTTPTAEQGENNANA